MRVHLDVLGWLHVLVGWVGVLTGTAWLLLAAGTASLATSTATRGSAVMWLLLIAGLGAALGGALMVATGHALTARQPGGRRAALLLAVPVLCILPFGTALGVYTFWALLNDDARTSFGRRLRAPAGS